MSLLGLLALGGCLDEECRGLQGESTSLRLGTGQDEFEPIEAGQGLWTEAGSQGGFHVWASIQATGVAPGDYEWPSDPDAPTIDFRLDSAELGALLSPAPRLRPLRRGAGTESWLNGILVQLDSTDPSVFVDQEVVFSVELVDRCGTRLEDQVGVWLRL